MRILVTGGAGFIGSHTLQALSAKNHETALLDDFNAVYDPAIKWRNAKLTDAEIYEGDIRNAADVKRALLDFQPEAVIHLAARAGVRPSLEEPQLYLDTNITGTLNILETMRGLGVGKLVFASSSSVYGANIKVPFSETDPLEGTISPYAATKIAGEHLCATYAKLYSIQTSALRFFTVYGPRQRPDLAIHKFTRRIYEGKPIPQFGNGETRRDYTYIDDIVQGILGALAYDETQFETFNLGESETTPLKSLIEMIENTLGIQAKIELLPLQPGDVETTYANISKARRLLSYNPQISLKQGIKQFVEWFLETREAEFIQ